MQNERQALRSELLVRHSDPARLAKVGVTRETYAQIYRGSAPWEIGRVQPAVEELARRGAFRGRILDVGCGTGENALYLAAAGHEVCGIDYVLDAVERARAKAAERGLQAEFVAADLLSLPPLGTFDTILDSATFHGVADGDRARYAQALRSLAGPGAVLYVLAFGDHEKQPGGPRRISQADIRSTFLAGWDVRAIRDAVFAAAGFGDARAWLAEIHAV